MSYLRNTLKSSCSPQSAFHRIKKVRGAGVKPAPSRNGRLDRKKLCRVAVKSPVVKELRIYCTYTTRTESTRLLAELLGNKDQIENVTSAIAIGVWRGLTEAVGNQDQIQDIDVSIAVEIGGIFAFEIDFAVEV